MEAEVKNANTAKREAANLASGKPAQAQGAKKPAARPNGDRRALPLSGQPPVTVPTLAGAFNLQSRSRVAAKAVAEVRSMKLPFEPQLAAMGDLWETMETGQILKGGKQIGCLMLDPTGCGKTTSAEAVAELACADDPDGIVSVVHCRLPASGTAIGLFSNALAKLGDTHMNQARESRLLTHLCERLEESGTKLLVIDETQQGAATSGIGGQIAAAVKLLLDTGVVPVALLGTEKAVEVLAKDRELAGRLAAPSSLAPLNWYDDDDKEIWIRLLTALDMQLKAQGTCSDHFGFADEDIAEKLIEVCNGTIGQLMGMVRTAVREMARAGRRTLSEGDVVFAIDAWCVGYGFTTHNPFGQDR
jgi:hypothetical protein